jgi:putative oxidoreductase
VPNPAFIAEPIGRKIMDALRPYTAQLLSVLRIMSGLLVLQHGTTKYLSIPVSQMSNVSPTTMNGAAA